MKHCRSKRITEEEKRYREKSMGSVIGFGACSWNSRLWRRGNEEGDQSDGKKTEEKAENKSEKALEPDEVLPQESIEEITGAEAVEVEKSENPVVGQKIAFFDLGSGDYIQIPLHHTAFLSNSNYKSIRELYDNDKEFSGVGPEDIVEGVGEEVFLHSLGLAAIEGEYDLSIMLGMNVSGKDQMRKDMANHAFK